MADFDAPILGARCSINLTDFQWWRGSVTLGFRECRGTASKSIWLEERADAGPSCTLVVPFDHASDGAVDSELPEAQRRLAFEPDAPPNPEGV